jgi:outer membrane immunogenic protein
MKKLLLGGLALAAMAMPLAANAADLSRPAPVYQKAPPPIPVTTWTGFYLGAYAGGGVGFSRYDFTGVGTSTGNFDISGGMAGGTGGFNLQNGAAVFGVEADGGWMGFRGNAPCPNPAFTCATSDTWSSTIRGRLGWAVGSNLLLYGTAGGAFGDVRSAITGPVAFTGATVDKAGWAAGAGVEWMFAPNWSAKLEYMHYDLGTATCGIGLCSAVTPANVRFEADTGKVGINYHFNWGPAMGRY